MSDRRRLLMNSGEDYLEFISIPDIIPSKSVTVSFLFDLSGSKIEPDQIVFSSSSEKISFGEFTYIIQDNIGTGRIQVTCDDSVGVGQIFDIAVTTPMLSVSGTITTINGLKRVEISPFQNYNIIYGNTARYTATAVFANGDTISDPYQFVWNVYGNELDELSIEYGVLTRGNIRGNASTATVEAVYMNEIGNITVKFHATQACEITSDDSVNISVGASTLLIVRLRPYNISTGATISTPISPTPQNMHYEVEDSSIVSATFVNGSGLRLTGNKVGSTKVTIIMYTSSFIAMKVVNVQVGSIRYELELTESNTPISNINISMGGTIGIQAYYITYDNNINVGAENVTGSVTVSSSNENVARTTLGNGYINIYGVNSGSCNIIVKYTGKKKVIRCNVSGRTFSYMESAVYAYDANYEDWFKITSETSGGRLGIAIGEDGYQDFENRMDYVYSDGYIESVPCSIYSIRDWNNGNKYYSISRTGDYTFTLRGISSTGPDELENHPYIKVLSDWDEDGYPDHEVEFLVFTV